MATDYSGQYMSKIKAPQKGSAEYGQVEKDANQEYLDRLNAIDRRIKQTQALRDADMGSLRRNANIAQRDINDQMFREYLATKERMGGRGLSNSGLMADAQIRLNANKQDRLAELYSQTQDKLGDVNRMYAPQQTELLGERANTRQSDIFKGMYKELLENRAREAQLLSPLVQNEFTSLENQKQRDYQTEQTEKSNALQRSLAAMKTSSGGGSTGGGGKDDGGFAFGNNNLRAQYNVVAKSHEEKLKEIGNDLRNATDPLEVDALTQQYQAEQAMYKAALQRATSYAESNEQSFLKANNLYEQLTTDAPVVSNANKKISLEQAFKGSKQEKFNKDIAFAQKEAVNPYNASALKYFKTVEQNKLPLRISRGAIEELERTVRNNTGLRGLNPLRSDNAYGIGSFVPGVGISNPEISRAEKILDMLKQYPYGVQYTD